MTGKVVVVTGANFGINGMATYVAGKEVPLYMLCRSADHVRAARNRVPLTGNSR
jgi:NADP-dependent 3-hydroxy acid dehydrogenase YdfG